MIRLYLFNIGALLVKKVVVYETLQVIIYLSLY